MFKIPFGSEISPVDLTTVDRALEGSVHSSDCWGRCEDARLGLAVDGADLVRHNLLLARERLAMFDTRDAWEIVSMQIS